MSETDRYEQWTRRRSAVEVPADFSDGVMGRLEESNAVTDAAATSGVSTLRHRIWNGCVAASVLAACFGIGMLRVHTLMALVLATSSEGL